MTKEKLHSLILDAQDCIDLEDFVSECGGSLPAAYYPEDGSPDKIISVLTDIWQFRDGLTFRKVLKISELTQAEISRRYDIPIRTIECWCGGSTHPKICLIELLTADIITNKYEEE